MSVYAQTYLQLHHQIRRMENSEGDLDYLRGAYAFVMQVFSGYVQGYGKSFLSHNVGTASILASLGAPIQVVAAGLMHNVYEGVDFGDGQTGITPSHQKTRSLGEFLKHQANLHLVLCYIPYHVYP